MPSPSDALAPCILCGSDAGVTLLETIPPFSVLYCRHCELRFSDPMSHPGGSFYEENLLYENRALSAVSPSFPELDWRVRTYFRVAPPKTGETLLDIGAGDGGMLAAAMARGAIPHGIEVDRRGVRIAREIRGLPNVEQGDFEKLRTLGWKDFDRVTCMEVMEHLPEPKVLVTLMHDLLRPGGIACLSVPRWDRFPALFDRHTDSPPHHFTLWTPRALEKIFRDAGYVDVTVHQAPLMLHNILYTVTTHLNALMARVRPRSSQPLPEAVPTGTTDEAPLVIDSKRQRNKFWAYTLLGKLDPLLRVIPGLRGATLMVLARKPF